ncbi:MAG: amidohydrolase family protein [Bifidobacterium sp.]|nr:amidohydrolase family protein [Bifidobacterium sp.]
MATTLFTNARLAGVDGPQDLLAVDGRFAAIGPDLAGRAALLAADGAPVRTVDLAGRLVTAPFCDTHLHLDYVFTAGKPGATNGTGTLFEGIQRWGETKADLTVADVKERAMAAVAKEVRHGVQYIRTHADVTDPKLTSLRALLELRDELRDTVTIQVVAMPQEGMYAYPGGRDLVEEGLKLGADCVGGIPHYEPCREMGERSMHDVVDLAVRYGRMIDVHCDETDDPMSRYVELLAALAHAEGIGAMTCASHTCSLGSVDDSYFFHLLKLLRASRLNFACAPTENLYLQGRQDTYPKRRGITRVKELTDAGVNVSLGQDSMCDPWYPLGNGNMMVILDYLLHVGQMMTRAEIDRALDFATVNGAVTMMLDDYGLAVGNPANFIVLDAASPFEAVYERADVLASYRAGEPLFTATTTVESPLEWMA